MIKHRHAIIVLTTFVVLYYLVFVMRENKVAGSYLALSVLTVLLSLLTLMLARSTNFSGGNLLVLFVLLVTAFQIIGLVKVFDTPRVVADMMPAWFGIVSSIVVLTIVCAIYVVLDWRERTRK